MTLITSAIVIAAAMAFWLGRVSSAPRPDEDAPFADLWLYQQALNDCGHDVDTLIEGTSTPLVTDAHVALVRARAAAYPRAAILRAEARYLLTRPSLPDLSESGMDLVDMAHAYLTLAERLADEIVRAQFGNRWHPAMVKPRVRTTTPRN